MPISMSLKSLNIINEYKYHLKYTIKVSKENATQLLNKFYLNERLKIKSSTSDVSKAFVWTVYLNHINVEKRKFSLYMFGCKH